MSETDPYDEDDAAEIASVVQAFAQINGNIETLNRNLGASTGTLGALIKTEYAGELARLGKSVDRLVQEQAGIAKTIGEHQEAVRSLHGASRSLKGQDARLSSVTVDLKELGRQLDGIVTRPAARAEQLWALIWFSGAGVLAGVLMVFLGLWTLPDRAETAVAAKIMGDSYWNSAWRMIEAHDPGRRQTLGVLTWVRVGSGEAEKHKACRNKAWDSGEHQECTVVFRPRRSGG
ncbi:MAG: DUF6118 family protein [Rhodobacteraceae bacterium]|nr:DUF6118 family protein [Paracoccaceae bacterium]